MNFGSIFFSQRTSYLSKVRRDYSVDQEFANRKIPCATVEGLVLLKLFALPSLYRQAGFDRVRTYQKDLADLIARYQPRHGTAHERALPAHAPERYRGTRKDSPADRRRNRRVPASGFAEQSEDSRMRNTPRRYAYLAALLCIVVAPRCEALTINLQYPGSPFFSATLDPLAKAAINAAASDLSAALTTSLNQSAPDFYSGSSGGANVTLGFEFNYRNPVTDAQTVVSNATIAANIVNIFVGARSLDWQHAWSQFSGVRAA